MNRRRPTSISFTWPQLFAVNSALALLQAELEDDDTIHTDKPEVVARAREQVFKAIRKGGQ